jgi:hypothetical protein
VLSVGHGRKTDPDDAVSVAVAGQGARPRQVGVEGHAVALHLDAGWLRWAMPMDAAERLPAAVDQLLADDDGDLGAVTTGAALGRQVRKVGSW